MRIDVPVRVQLGCDECHRFLLSEQAKWAAERDRYRETLERVTGALDDAIKCACNGGFPGNGWSQEHYDEWAAAREAAEHIDKRALEGTRASQNPNERSA